MSTTATTAISTVIGIFLDHNQANRAIDELRRANFSYGRMRLVERGSGRFFDALKGMFTGQAETASSTADNLVKMGMPDYEAQYYQRDLDADHVLLLMNADDRPEEAFNIMRQNGAFDIHSRLRMTSDGSGQMRTPAGSTTNDSRDGSQAASRLNAPPTPASPKVAASPAPPDTSSAAFAPNEPQGTFDEDVPEDTPNTDAAQR